MSKKTMGKYFCKNCGFLDGVNVTFHEACALCDEPVKYVEDEDISVVERLQREKAELGEKNRMSIIICKEKTKAILDLLEEVKMVQSANAKIRTEHTTLVERVKVHNENIANMHKHFPSSNWATYLIDLDTQEGGN